MAEATLTVDASVRLLQQPHSVGLLEPGDSATFTAVADGPDLFYQWYHEGAVILGANSSVLTIANADFTDDGAYFLVVSNFVNHITSATVTLTFSPNALRINHLDPVSGRIGCPVTIAATVIGVPPIFLQWYKDGTLIPDATNVSLSIAALHSADLGSYYLVASNEYRSVTSNPAPLTASDGPNGPALVIETFQGSIVLTFNGEQGRMFQLFRSADLLEWELILTATPFTSGPIQRIEAPPAAGGRRFYSVAVDCP